MARFEVTENEKDWLQANHPDLYFDSEKHIIRGELFFKMYWSKKDGYVLNPDDSYKGKDGILIQDVYEIEIDLSKRAYLPQVREVARRIVRSKEKWNIEELIDMHVLSDGTACLCVKTEERAKMPNGFNLKDFFENLIIPFFYYQSFFEKYGKEPWKGYNHGFLGVLESYLNYENQILPEIIDMFLNCLPDNLKSSVINNHQIKGHHLCCCGSKKKSRNCYKDVLFGYNKLRNDYHKIKKQMINQQQRNQ